MNYSLSSVKTLLLDGIFSSILSKCNYKMVGYNMDGPARDQVMKLIEEKSRLENEILQHNLVLAENNVGMRDPLVDGDGFPRTDIDVYKVRHARHTIICLQNDHKNIMKQIEKGLGEVHSQFRGQGEGTSRNTQQPTASHTNGDTLVANNTNSHDSESNSPCFAVIGFVQEGSPADLGGLCESDEVLQFGTVNHGNFTDITQVHNIVAHSVGQPIQVQVRRGSHILSVTVVPRPWAQPGFLGCQISRKS